MVAVARGPALTVLGRQGSGKGTQGQRLASHLGLQHLSTGAVLRSAVEAQTEVGQRVQHFLAEGQLVPDELMLEVVRTALSPSVRQQGFLLDGYPRTRSQAEALDGLVAPHGLDAVILLEVSLDEVRRRLTLRRVCPRCETPTVATADEPEVVCPTCGGMAVVRDDDTPDAIERRLEAHERESAPLVQWYADRGLLVRVDAMGTADAVFERVLQSVRPALVAAGHATA